MYGQYGTKGMLKTTQQRPASPSQGGQRDNQKRREILFWIIFGIVGILAFLFLLFRVDQRIAVFKGQDTFQGKAQEIGVLQDSFQEIKNGLKELREAWDVFNEIEQ